MSDRQPVAPLETTLDWEQARRRLRSQLAHRLPSLARAELDDLVQEALIGLLRAMRREEVRDPEALLFTIAQRTSIDYLRRKKRWALIVQDDPTGAYSRTLPARSWAYGDVERRVRFAVLRFFRDRRSSCHDLAMSYFEERDWASIARASGRSHDGVRKQWSRCLEFLRQFVSRDRFLASLIDCVEE